MPFLFPDHHVGYRDPPEDFMGDDPHWDGVAFPPSPTPHAQTPDFCPNVRLHSPATSNAFISDSSDEVTFDSDDLDMLTSRQVMYAIWPHYNLATGVHAQCMQIWVRHDIGIPDEFLKTPVMFRKMWRGAIEDPDSEPMWISKDVIWRIMARESAVRRVAHLARKPFNAVVSNDLLMWSLALTLDPNPSVRFDRPSNLIWRPTTPSRRPSPRSVRQHAERTRVMVFNAQRDFGLE
ncbi:hypothetical protein Hypma_000640 [Hypsizygus marmoreus]|uniref:Uncharacterized protein n=1 Tax=Hypsizygus marmoreus TaxID=39966 RepID=A0A369JHH1_HYPMA|nr:hypothetical protein Hypma_000640 [Hypsizygus marmoreus]